MTNRAHHPTEESLLDRMAERPTPELVAESSTEDDTQPAAAVVAAAGEPDLLATTVQHPAAAASPREDSSRESRARESTAPEGGVEGAVDSEEAAFEQSAFNEAPFDDAHSDQLLSGALMSADLRSAGLLSAERLSAERAQPVRSAQAERWPEAPSPNELSLEEVSAEELLPDELSAEDRVNASSGGGAPDSEQPTEVSFEDLESEAPDSLEADAVEVGLITGEPPSFEPRAAQPWVDEVPDPVTPYEQRVSETIKVADLPPVDLLRGRVVANRYLAEELAEKTPACVSYRAYHLALDRAVTVRVLPRGLACSDELCQEVRRVARLATELSDVHVAATLDFGVTNDGWPFAVTEHYAGRTLSALLAEEGKFVLRRVLHIGKQIADGLSVAHQAGLIHGFLSPDNVMVIDPGTSAEVATILGFGVVAARGISPGPPRSGVFGVPFYVSPEQASCKPLDLRSDLYSVGVILYQLMVGSPPFGEGDFAAVLCQHLDDDAPPPSTRLRAPGALAKAMDAIVERCLRKDPDKRYQSAAELAEDLTRLEAAAARNKRRPMPEIARPTTTIHAPAPRVDSHHAGAKVIVNGAADEAPRAQPPASSPKSAPSAPQVRPALAAARAARAAEAARAEATPAVRRTPRIATDQATIRISAVDREAAMAHYRNASARQSWGMALHGFRAALGTSFALLARWLIARVTWLLGGAQRFVAAANRREGPASAASASAPHASTASAPQRRSESPSHPGSSAFGARSTSSSVPPAAPPAGPGSSGTEPSSGSAGSVPAGSAPPSSVPASSPSASSAPAVASPVVEKPVSESSPASSPVASRPVQAPPES